MLTTREDVTRKHAENKPRLLLDLMVSATDPEEHIATEISEKLFEPKNDLILSMVQLIGGEKAIELFKETQKLEEAGGQIIKNGKRRRTSGGIFLFLISQDATIPKDKVKQILKEANKKYLIKIRNLRANTEKITKELLHNIATDPPTDSEIPSVSHAEAAIPAEQESNPPTPEIDASDYSTDTYTDDEEDFHMTHPEQPKPCVLCMMEQNRRAEVEYIQNLYNNL